MQEQQAAPLPGSNTTISQKVTIFANLALFPAMSLLVFIRRKPGYRFLSPTRLFVSFILLWCIAGIAGGAASFLAPQSSSYYPGAGASAAGNAVGAAVPLFLFALAVLITGLVKRALRFRAIKRGERWHTYSRGISLFEGLPLNDSQVKRYVDPGIAFIFGLLLLIIPFLRPLGYWLMFSAFCLFIWEQWDYEQALNRDLDILDSLTDAEVSGEVADIYAQPENQRQQPLERTAGIPTGIAPDIAAQIERRRRNRQAGNALPPPSANAQNPQAQQPSYATVPPSQSYGQQWQQGYNQQNTNKLNP